MPILIFTLGKSNALQSAIRFENFETVELLLDKKANPNDSVFGQVMNPLKLARARRNNKIINLLKQHGAQ